MKEKQPQSSGAVATQIATPDWKAFLRILAPQFITRDKDIFISKEDDIISFEIETATLKEFQEHFDRVLQSSESLDLQLSYTHNTAAISSSSSSAQAQTFERPSIQTVEQAKNFMKTLFGVDTMRGCSDCAINFDHFFVDYKHGVLSSNPKNFASYELAKNGQKFLCEHLDRVTTQDLRKIIAGEAEHLKAPDENKMDVMQGEGFVQTCFCIVEDKTDPKKLNFRMHFNIGRFLQLIYPPQIQAEEVTESKTRVTISASHLLLYVKQLSRHGILFTVEAKYGKVSAQPLVFPHKETIQKRLTVFIVLDDSGSMEKYRDELFKNVTLLIKKIALVAPKADIRLTLFSSKNQQKNYKGKAENFDFACFSQPSLSGLTALYDAISTRLEQMKDILNTDNTMLIVFTDGKNNDSVLKEEDILKQIAETQEAVSRGGMPPEIHAIGYGEDLDTNVLNSLAEAAFHKAYTKLESFESLGAIMHGIEGFEHGRVVAEFRTVIDGIEQTNTLPICLDGQPHVVRQVTVPLSSKPVQVSFTAPTKGQELALSQVTLQITVSYAQKQMKDYEERIETIYKESWMPAKKIAELNGVLSEMNTFCTRAPQQIVLELQDRLQEKIQTYNDELRAKHDARSPAESSSTSIASSPSLGRDSPINAGAINSSARIEERKVSSPTPR